MQFSNSDYLGFDFETYYDAEYSLKKMSTWNYVFHEKFDAYLLAVYDGKDKWVGNPNDFDWSSIKDKTLVMHNASFDELVIKRLQQDGKAPADLGYKGCLDTADLAVWMGAPRDLKGACRELLGLGVSKAVRDAMKGKTAAAAEAEGMTEELEQYGADDAIHAWQLCEKYRAQWPEKEQWLSNANRLAGFYGVALDLPLIEAARQHLHTLKFDNERNIPWAEEGRPALSLPALREYGRKVGIPVPASLAKTSEDAVAWVAQYGKDHPWIQAVGDYRRVNMQLGRVEALHQNARADGTMAYQLKYFGAGVTGRMSGGGDSGGKFNMQNMPRKAIFDVDVRPMVRARPGHVYILSDYGQIEARMLLWRAGDQEFADEVARVGNIYIAYAKKAFGTDIKKGTDDYQLAKAEVLGLGYQCAAPRFKALAAEEPYFLELTDDEAQRAVATFRGANPKIVKHWQQHQQWLKISAIHKDPTHEVELASGRTLTYFNPRISGRDVVCQYYRGGPFMKIHSGILTNNEIQGTARDLMVEAMYVLQQNGLPFLWTVHDEIIFERPEATAEADLKVIEEIMVTSSPWAKGCPLAVESNIKDHYCK